MNAFSREMLDFWEVDLRTFFARLPVKRHKKIFLSRKEISILVFFFPYFAWLDQFLGRLLYTGGFRPPVSVVFLRNGTLDLLENDFE